MRRKTKDYRELYKDFYNKFRKIALPNVCHPYNLVLDIVNREGSDLKEASLKEPIFLKDWPVKKNLPAKRVDILIHAEFRFRPESMGMLHNRSTIFVTYFDRNKKGEKATPFENMRFDFDPESEADDEIHPLIHAHVFSNKIPKFELPPYVKYEVEWRKINKRFISFRLPIPNMNFPSVLCCLVACHLGADKIKELLSQTEDLRGKLPGLAIEEKQQRLLFENSLSGSQWFLRA